ncbi:hypothetical protein Angca_000723 [Angiostrongylus cantonensis]|nr:hypothetical protein Angca_000723 [Angiostrongylus cantonensis]
MTSSPVTSVSEGQTADVWRVSPVRRDGREVLSPTSDTSAVHENTTTRIADSKKEDKPKTVEIKVERTERVERREKFENKDWLNSNDVYAMSKMQPSLGSRSSLATSQARGESSDIDFSWIREEENKLRNERENVKQLPKCYFGMDPPKLEDPLLSCNIRDEKENRRTGNGNVRTTAAAFEKELIRKKRDQVQKSHSSNFDDHHVPQRELGPMARRLQRIQRGDEATRNYDERDDRQQWRSSMAF